MDNKNKHGPQGERPPLIYRTNAPRLNVELTEEQHQKIDMYIPRGHRKVVFHAIIDDLLCLLENSKNRNEILAFVIGRQLNLARITTGVKEEE